MKKFILLSILFTLSLSANAQLSVKKSEDSARLVCRTNVGSSFVTYIPSKDVYVLVLDTSVKIDEHYDMVLGSYDDAIASLKGLGELMSGTDDQTFHVEFGGVPFSLTYTAPQANGSHGLSVRSKEPMVGVCYMYPTELLNFANCIKKFYETGEVTSSAVNILPSGSSLKKILAQDKADLEALINF